jgi:hypothetical protein
MKSILAFVIGTSSLLGLSFSYAEDATAQLTGTWKVISWLTKFDGGDTVEPYGPNPGDWCSPPTVAGSSS